jgi:hypothetical protein
VFCLDGQTRAFPGTRIICMAAKRGLNVSQCSDCQRGTDCIPLILATSLAGEEVGGEVSHSARCAAQPGRARAHVGAQRWWAAPRSAARAQLQQAQAPVCRRGRGRAQGAAAACRPDGCPHASGHSVDLKRPKGGGGAVRWHPLPPQTLLPAAEHSATITEVLDSTVGRAHIATLRQGAVPGAPSARVTLAFASVRLVRRQCLGPRARALLWPLRLSVWSGRRGGGIHHDAGGAAAARHRRRRCVAGGRVRHLLRLL